MVHKKNRIFMFICSFMPGALEMYIGFMKNGVSLMAVFFLSLMIPFTLYLNDAFICVVALVWFYSFFHAIHLKSMDEEILADMPDKYIWNEFFDDDEFNIPSNTLRRWFSYAIIIIGVIVLWKNVSRVIYQMIPEIMWDQVYPVMESLPQLAIALFLIILGIRMIRGKKVKLNALPEFDEDER